MATYDSDEVTIIVLVLGVIFLVFIIFISFFLSPGSGERVVNMPGLGAKVCDTQGLIYYNYTLGVDRVPVFVCTKNTTRNVFIQDHFIQYVESPK